MSAVLTDLTAGHTFEPISFVIDAEKARAYRAATGDTQTVYDDASAVPPLAVAALALGALLEVVTLPDGTLHASESMQALSPVPVGAALTCIARVAQRSSRGGWNMIALESQITVGGETALTTRATVMCPGEPS